MGRGVNKVILIGNCGQDPETRYTAAGSAITNVTIATSESWKDKQTGQKQERTEWHRVVFFNRLAEIAGEYIKKGSKIYVEGKLQTRKWKDQQGQDRYTTEIVASEMQMLDSRETSGQAAQAGLVGGPPRQQVAQQAGNGFPTTHPTNTPAQAPAQHGAAPYNHNAQPAAESSSDPPQEMDSFDDGIPF